MTRPDSDAPEIRFAWVAESMGFDLRAFDDWLGELEPCPARDELLALRVEAKAADRARLRPLLELMHARRFLIDREGFLLPLARKGDAFKPGKPEGAAGPIQRAVSTYLRKHPKASAAEVWIALHDRPPKGYTFVDNPRLGKYIEHGAVTVMAYPRFQNVVSERRPAKAKREYKRA